MLSLIGLIPTILTTLTGLGGTATSITKSITDLQMARERAKSDTEIKKIDAEIMAIHDRKDVMVAEAGSRINGFMRAAIAVGPATYIFKYFFIDKFLGAMFLCSGDNGEAARCSIFATDGLNPVMAAVMTAVLGFYFLSSNYGKK